MAAIIMEVANNADPKRYLENLASEIKSNPPQDTNGGHDALCLDLANLVEEAFHYEFHDFKNGKYAAPKIELRNKLLELAQNVVNGKYDN